MEEPALIKEQFIEGNTSFSELIAEIQFAFASGNIVVPQRHHHNFPNPNVGKTSTLLLMPAWNPGGHAGVKMVTINPENGWFDLPSIQGT